MARVLVAGATGVIGRRLVPRLVAAGHEVIGMTRSAQKLADLASAGARGVVCDALDRGGLAEAVAAARPEIVIHELTSIPKAIDPRRFADQFAANDRLRIEGTANLMAAAQTAGARRVVAQSIAFAYPPGSGLGTEEEPLWLDAPVPWRRSVEALVSLESRVTGTEGVEGTVLRYGHFYGPGTAYAPDGHVAGLVRRRQFPIVGKGTGVYSFLHIEDAAQATLRAIESDTTGIFNIVDDDPAMVTDWLPAYAESLGAPAPRRVPAFLARLLAGPQAVLFMTRMRGASNARARRRLGWEPRLETWRTGFKDRRA